MATKKRGLGRGLDALLGSGTAKASTPEPGAASGQLQQLPVEQIQRGRYQPRTDMDQAALEELAASIRAQGVVQPIVVRPLEGKGRYEIIAGERRWRAAQIAELAEIPVVVRDVSDRAAIAIALIENIQRENLNPVEEAQALKRLLDEFEMTHQQAADSVGRSRAAVTNLLRLLELLPDVKSLLENGDLEMGHARALLGLAEDTQRQAAKEVVSKGLSVRETEQLVRRLQSAEGKTKVKPTETDPNIRRLQEDLAQQLGASVRIQHSARGKGRVVIQYHNLDELEGILAHIK